MAWHALEEFDAALEDTKELLLPFDWRTWAKVALLVFLTGGVNMPGSNYSSIFDSNEFDSSESSTFDYSGVGEVINGFGPTGAISASPYGLGVSFYLIVLLVLIVAALFLFLSAIFEFVYYQSLLDKAVVLQENARKHARNGAQLFGFRIAMFIIALLAVAIIGGAAVIQPAIAVGVIFALAPFIIIFFIVIQLTNQFVTLYMIENEVSLIDAWRELYPMLRKEWKQTGMYVVVRFLASIVIGIIAGIASVVLLLIPAIPLAILVIGLNLNIGAVVLAVAGIALFLWFIVSLILIDGPAETYLRYYTIRVYHDIVA